MKLAHGPQGTLEKGFSMRQCEKLSWLVEVATPPGMNRQEPALRQMDHQMRSTGYTKHITCLPQPAKHCCDIVQVWIGYNQSLGPCQSGLTLNMDITAAAFLEGQPMLQLIGSTVGMQNVSGGLNPGQVKSIQQSHQGRSGTTPTTAQTVEACSTVQDVDV